MVISGLTLAFLAMVLSPPLWRHWVTYPKLEKQISEFQKKRKEPPTLTHLGTYPGAIHVHSYLSHDSEGTLYDLTTAAKDNGLRFIFLTDHPRYDLDTIPKGYHGNYDGLLIESGSEKQGFNCWPLDSTVINWKMNKDTVAKNVVANGGIIFYAHTEEPHNWSSPYYQGMEIYNFHTDTKDESLFKAITNFLINGKKFRSWVLREMFDEQTTILARWDSLNMKRKIVGFSAIDAHENQNFRARKLEDGRIQWIGPNAKPIDTVNVNIWNQWLFSEPDPDGWVFKWMVDTYQSGFNYVANYALSDTLTIASIADNIRKGHLYTAFKSLGDATGFLYYSTDLKNQLNAIMGDSIKASQVNTLKAVSPLPGEFRLIHDGKIVNISPDTNYEYSWSGPIIKGAYRMEVHLKFHGKNIPWIYSNPIYIY